MQLTLERKIYDDAFTSGDLFVDGVFFCHTLEDCVRQLPARCPWTSRGEACRCSAKRYGQTAIPAGRYRVSVDYSPRFGRRLPRVHDVPHFLGILIHSGNTAHDSAGCILVGRRAGAGRLTVSRAASDRLTRLLEKAGDAVLEIR